MRILSLLFITVLVFTSCKKELSTEEQQKKDVKDIKEYIEANNLSAEQTESGLFYVIDKKGAGNHPSQTDKVRVRYKGYNLDKEVFDQSEESGIAFNLQQVIKGWTKGIPYFKEGGKGVLLIPSSLGYGPEGNSSIPPNTALVFEIELLEIVE